MKYKYEIKELDRFNKALDSLVKLVPDGLLKAFKVIMMDLLARVKKLTPVDKGNLRRKWALGKIKNNGSTIEGEIFNNTKYAMPVEVGHKKRGGGFVVGRFMMRKAFTESKNNIVNTLEREVQRIADKELR